VKVWWRDGYVANMTNQMLKRFLLPVLCHKDETNRRVLIFARGLAYHNSFKEYHPRNLRCILYALYGQFLWTGKGQLHEKTSKDVYLRKLSGYADKRCQEKKELLARNTCKRFAQLASYCKSCQICFSSTVISMKREEFRPWPNVEVRTRGVTCAWPTLCVQRFIIETRTSFTVVLTRFSSRPLKPVLNEFENAKLLSRIPKSTRHYAQFTDCCWLLSTVRFAVCCKEMSNRLSCRTNMTELPLAAINAL